MTPFMNNRLAEPALKHPGGRPTKFTPAALRKILRSARRGLPLTLIAKGIGMTTQCLINYRKAHDHFELALQRSIAKGVDARLRKIQEACDAGDWRAAAWMLEKSHPEFFAKNRLEVSGPDGAPLSAGVQLDLPRKDGGAVVETSELAAVPALTEGRPDGNGD
jgi:hypothetical protein